jgi:hypothetical protein
LAPPYAYAKREEASADSVKQKVKDPATPDKMKAPDQVPGSTESSRKRSARLAGLPPGVVDTRLETVQEEVKGNKQKEVKGNKHPKTTKKRNT